MTADLLALQDPYELIDGRTVLILWGKRGKGNGGLDHIVGAVIDPGDDS